jgi:cytoskeleton protein RodZ
MIDRVNDRPMESKLGAASAPLGPKLKAAREALNWTVEQVAEQLKWSPRQVSALEADNYQILHGMATVRGFVRAYAKLLKLDPAPLLASLENVSLAPDDLLPVRRELAAPLSKVRLPSMHKRGLSPHAWGLIAAVVLVIGVVVAGQMGFLKPLPPDLLQRASVSAALPSGAASRSASATQVAIATTKVIPLANPSLSSSLNPSANPPVIASPNPVASPVLANANPAQPSGDAASNVLVLQIRKDSWIEVKRVNGNIMLSRLLKAGETETVAMDNPVQVVIGNVAGVEATLRGEPLTLKTGAGNTARITLK